VSTKTLTLDEIYARIPSISCKRQCHTTCGLIPLSRAESERARVRGLRVVPNQISEWMLEPSRGACPALVGIECTIYDDRPLICRLFGVVEGLECRWGCKPERLLTRQEAAELLRASRRAVR